MVYFHTHFYNEYFHIFTNLSLVTYCSRNMKLGGIRAERKRSGSLENKLPMKKMPSGVLKAKTSSFKPNGRTLPCSLRPIIVKDSSPHTMKSKNAWTTRLKNKILSAELLRRTSSIGWWLGSGHPLLQTKRNRTLIDVFPTLHYQRRHKKYKSFSEQIKFILKYTHFLISHVIMTFVYE